MVRYRIKKERSEWTETFARLKDAIAYAAMDERFSIDGKVRKGVYIVKESSSVAWAVDLDTRDAVKMRWVGRA